MPEKEAKEASEEIGLLKDLGPVKEFLSTGCTLLDLAIADKLPGGIPVGRITQVYGDESTGKTVLGYEVIGSAQRKGGKGFFDNIEGTCDLDRARDLHGVAVDSKRLGLFGSTSIEGFFDTTLKAAIEDSEKVKKVCCLVVDSLSALPSLKELSSELSEATFGTTRAAKLSAGFRKNIDPINESKLALLFVDQTRENVGVTFGDTKTTSGGKALKFYASVRILLSYVERIKNANKHSVGVKLGFFIKKNKIGPPFREGTFRLLFDYGIDDVGSSIEWLHENDPDNLKGEKKTWGISALKLTGRGLNELCEKVEAENLENELAKEVERVWRSVYQLPDRKKRVRLD